jgi:hypothetical protein
MKKPWWYDSAQVGTLLLLVAFIIVVSVKLIKGIP